MSYRSWEIKNFLVPPLPVRIWTHLSRRGMLVRAAWRRKRREAAVKALQLNCGDCHMNGSSFCPCKKQP